LHFEHCPAAALKRKHRVTGAALACCFFETGAGISGGGSGFRLFGTAALAAFLEPEASCSKRQPDEDGAFWSSSKPPFSGELSSSG
jgi:hypothetical protein